MRKKMSYCNRCMYPSVAVNLSIDDEGICASCRTAEEFEKLSPEFWDKRRQKFEQKIEEIRKNNSSEYDCIIPVSGGKEQSVRRDVRRAAEAARGRGRDWNGARPAPASRAVPACRPARR